MWDKEICGVVNMSSNKHLELLFHQSVATTDATIFSSTDQYNVTDSLERLIDCIALNQQKLLKKTRCFDYIPFKGW
jgi:hypothetical protein